MKAQGKSVYWGLWWVPTSFFGLVALVSVMDLAWPGFIGGIPVWSGGRQMIGTWGSILLTGGFAATAWKSWPRGWGALWTVMGVLWVGGLVIHASMEIRA